MSHVTYTYNKNNISVGAWRRRRDETRVLDKSVYEVPWSEITDNATDAFCPVHFRTSWLDADINTYEHTFMNFHRHGQKFRTSQRRTREVTWQYGRHTLKGNVWQKWNKIKYSTFWLTGNKCRDPVEFLKVSLAILISWFSSTNVTGPAFHRCIFSKFGPYNALQNRGLKSHFCIPSRFDPL